MEDAGPGKRKLNAKSFAIHKGNTVYVTVAVLAYRKDSSDPAEVEGYEQMVEVFKQQPELTASAEVRSLETDWYMMSPMNSATGGVDGSDDDDL